MNSPRILFACFLLAALGCTGPIIEQNTTSKQYDLVISGGRVMDPETGLDAIRNIAINGERIELITEDTVNAQRTINAAGMVVAPGFIDLHNHSPTPLGHRYQALDGVTTSLELEAGAHPISKFGSLLKNGSALNYGASTGHATIRVQLMLGLEYPHMLDAPNSGVTFNGKAFTEKASPEEIEQLRAGLHEGLDGGGLGIGLLLDYMSQAVSDDELRMVFEVAGERKAPVFVHIRRGLAGDISGLLEVIELAKQTGAPVHICHLQHSAMKGTSEFLKHIRQARADGVDITTEVLPFNAGSTTISAAVFYRDWQAIFDISYEDVEWAATGMRFTKETWHEYQEKHPEGSVIHHYVDEAWTHEVIAADDVIIITDGLPAISEEIGVPPQGIGSFSRILGRYTRDKQALSLMSALKKMTLMPAQRLEKIAPVFTRKGRLQVGADADITVFDAKTIIDNTTYRKPYQASTGVKYVLVNGELIVEDGSFIPDSLPGRLISSLNK